MTRLDRYILARLLWVFGFFALVLVAVAWVNRASRLFDRVISDGQPLPVFLEFSLLSLPLMIRIVLPIAGFVAAVYVTLNLLRSNELTVAQAAGLSPFRLAWPVFLFGLVVAMFLSVLMHFLIPAAFAQRAQLQEQIARNITGRLLQPGTFHHPDDRLTVFISEITEDGELRGIFVSDSRSARQRIDYTARSALVVTGQDGPKLVMIDGFAQILDQRTGRLFTTTFGDFTYDLSVLIGTYSSRPRVEELTTPELFNASEETIAQTRGSPARFAHELVARFVDPLLSVASALLGFAVLIAARFSRLGFWRPVLAAVALLAMTEALTNAMAAQALRGPGFAWLAVLPLVVAMTVALATLARATRSRRPRPRRPALQMQGRAT